MMRLFFPVSNKWIIISLFEVIYPENFFFCLEFKDRTQQLFAKAVVCQGLTDHIDRAYKIFKIRVGMDDPQIPIGMFFHIMKGICLFAALLQQLIYFKFCILES